MRLRIIFLWISFLFFNTFLWAQNYNKLVDKKQQLLKESKALSQALKATQKTQKTTVEAISILNAKINIHNEILDVYRLEIEVLKKEELLIEEDLAQISLELEDLIENYTLLIKAAHETQHKYNKLLFFLASGSFNQLARRIHHFKQLETNRRNRFIAIQNLKIKQKEKRLQIIEKKAQQIDLRSDKKEEIGELNSSLVLQQKVKKSLQKKADSLDIAIQKRQKQAEQITRTIQDIIKKQQAKEKSLTPEGKIISSNFASNKGDLPWPVNTGTIISNFGKTPHPFLSGISIENNGVEISTQSKQVQSIFNGEVSKIIVLPNGLKVVILRHGEYLTVYTNLYNTAVNVGQKVKTGDVVGVLYNDNKEKSRTLGLQIWKARTKLNPRDWISGY